MPCRIDAPRRRGHVRIKSRDPHQHPGILFNYMSHEQDWQEFRDAIRITREIMHQPALDQYRGREISPVSNARRMSSSMSSCVTTPKPRFIRAVPAKWVMTRWLWLTAKAAYTGWKACAWWMRQLCRKLSPAIWNADDYDWRENSGYDSWEGSAAEEHGGIFCGKWDDGESEK